VASVAAVAAVAASDKHEHKRQGSRIPPSFFYYKVMDGDLYPDVIMMLRAIDVHNKQHRSWMSNSTRVIFFKTAACRLRRHQRTDIYNRYI
jgi:hypothetical protein